MNYQPKQCTIEGKSPKMTLHCLTIPLMGHFSWPLWANESIIPKPECFGDFGEVPLLNHHLGWPTGGRRRYNLPRPLVPESLPPSKDSMPWVWRFLWIVATANLCSGLSPHVEVWLVVFHQPIWKICASQIGFIFPKFPVKIKTYLKPPPSC